MATTYKELGTIALTGANGRNLCCDANNACAFSRDWIQAWEQFTVFGLPDGRVALRSWKNLYLHAAADQYHVWFCASSVGENESFEMVFTGSKMSLRTSFGKYLTCELDADIRWLVCRATWNMAWEQFGVTVCSGSFEALVGYKRDLEAQKERDEEKRRLERERAEMERRLQQQINQEREARRIENERRQKEERQRRKEDAEARLRILGRSIKQSQRAIEELYGRIGEEEMKLNAIHEKLIKETSARTRFEPPNAEDCVKVVLLGITGYGKSTLANRLLGDSSSRGNMGPFSTSAGRRSMHSHTEKIQVDFVDACETRFCVVDTPGEDDSRGRDMIHRTNLVDCLRGIGKVHAFVLVWNFGVQRLGMHAQLMLREMERILGDSLWRNLMIVMTRVDDDEAAEEFLESSRNLPNEIGDMFGLDVRVVSTVEVIGIGKRSFDAKRRQIFDAVLACNGGIPFVSQNLVAPVEERQAELVAQSGVCHELERKLNALLEEQEEWILQKSEAEHLIEELSRKR